MSIKRKKMCSLIVNKITHSEDRRIITINIASTLRILAEKFLLKYFTYNSKKLSTASTPKIPKIHNTAINKVKTEPCILENFCICNCISLLKTLIQKPKIQAKA